MTATTKFEEIGVDRQMDSCSEYEAESRFRRSCFLCCHRGIKIDCDACAIAHVHDEVVTSFREAAGKSAAKNVAEIHPA